MNAFLIYLIEVNINLALFAIAFAVLISNERRHRLNRWVLLSSSLLAFSIPLIQLPSPAVYGFPVFNLDPVIVGGEVSVQNSTIFNLQFWIIVLYLTGCLLALFSLFRGIFKLFIILHKANTEVVDGVKFVRHAQIETPASFFNYLFLPLEISHEALPYIVAHEKVHIREFHSIDLIFIRIVSALCWFNPSVYFLRKKIEETHEYLADAAVIEQFSQPQRYKEIIVSQALNIPPDFLAHSFSKSNLIKNRLMMLNSKKPKNTAIWKYLYLLPVCGALIFLHACSDGSTPPQRSEAQDLSDMNSASPDTKIYDSVDEMPEFPGGTAALMKFLSENVNYPDACKKEGVEGTVYIGFVIDEQGNATNLKVLKSPDDRLSANALEVLSKMPQWTPGREGNEAVKVHYNLPIRYQLAS